MKIRKYKLNNLSIVLAHMDTSSTTVEVLAKAGSINEKKDKSGISHFLEHMFFKGGKKYKTPLEVSSTLDEIGGSFNAFTSYEYAGYYIKTAPNFVEISIDVLSDMLVNGKFPIKEIEKEKQVVLQELKMIEDDPMKLAMVSFNKFYFGDNSYGWPVIGFEENILNFTQDDLIKHKQALYTKDNLAIVVAGKIIDENKILDLIASKFNNLPDKKTIDFPSFPGITSEKEGFLKKNTQQNHLVIGIPGFDIFSPKKYVAEILGVILGGNMSSVLFQELREKLGLCYYVWASHSARYNHGIFVIRAGLDKNKFNQGKDKINEILDNFAKGLIPKDKFEKAKSYLIGSLQIGLETSDEVADFVLFSLLFKNKIVSVEEIIENIQNVSYEEVVLLAKEVFLPDKRKIFWVE